MKVQRTIASRGGRQNGKVISSRALNKTALTLVLLAMLPHLFEEANCCACGDIE